MHENSMALMAQFFGMILDKFDGMSPWVLDVGSLNVNGTYKALLPKSWLYTGFDQQQGPNVDVTSWDSVLYMKYDIVISGQCLEHTENPFTLCSHIRSALKPGGYCCLVAPNSMAEHRHPIDCWRFLPDGMEILLRHAGCTEIMRCDVVKRDDFPQFSDCVGIGRTYEGNDNHVKG